ncbi:MAG: hypothetical protein EOP54_16495 [Sphingobacteriales bacterium]|nr:MAG: hypothetical protein EOP54_16495 [Sphingobacteriales bacterium]
MSEAIDRKTKAGYSFREYIPIFMLTCFSGNPLFTSGVLAKPLLIAYVALFGLLAIKIRPEPTTTRSFNRLFILSGIIILLCLFQYIGLGFVSVPGVFALILKLLLALLTFLYYKQRQLNIFDLYIRILPFIVMVSLPLFALNFITHFGIPLENTQIRSQILYTSFNFAREELRNPGLFWEPGAFAGYLNLGLIFIVLQNRGFVIGKYKKQIWWIIVGVLSTMSTMGYLAFACIAVFYILNNYPYGKYVLLPVAIIGGYISYYELDFLSAKIEDQYEVALDMGAEDVSNQRFGALTMDLQYIEDRPITGNGLNAITRYRFHPWINEDIGHGNGMSNFIVWWGIPFFIFYLFSFFQYTVKATSSKLVGLAIVFLVMLLLQGEQFLNYPLFLLFFILPAFEYYRYEDPGFHDEPVTGSQ